MLLQILLIIFILLVIFLLYKKLKNKSTNSILLLNENLVIIPSILHLIDSPLRNDDDYELNHLDVIPLTERFKLTLNTINSVKQKIPNAYVVVIEGSKLTKKEQLLIYDAGCDYIHECIISKDIKDSVKYSVTELNMILHFLNSKNNINKITTNFLTLNKISACFFLTKTFDFSKYSMDKIVYDDFYYRIPIKMINQYVQILQATLIDPIFLKYETNNYNMFGTLDKKLVESSHNLGVAGVILSSGQYVEDFNGPSIII